MIPNIERVLKIRVYKNGDEYRADAKVLSETSTVSIDKTREAAKSN